jgi:hypothetical protein
MHRLKQREGLSMSNTSNIATLAGLRARTDRELIAIIGSTLERGLELMRRNTNGGAVEQHRAEAEQAYAEVVKLVRLIYRLRESDRRRLEEGLADLRSTLDTAGGGEAKRVQAAGG